MGVVELDFSFDCGLKGLVLMNKKIEYLDEPELIKPNIRFRDW